MLTTMISNGSMLHTDSLIHYTLHLADNALILSQRNSEWCGHGPVLEQDIAITNISLDLLGQARNFYQYAAVLIGGTATEDKLAYHRNENEFKNCLLTEQPKGDWAVTILRQFFFSAYQYLLYRQLAKSTDTQLAAIASKAIKEVTYHLRWSSEWVIRLGDGTDESHARMVNAIQDLWMFTGELFLPAPYETEIQNQGIITSVEMLHEEWIANIANTFAEATLAPPTDTGWMQTGGKTGRHTEYLGRILAELQYMQRIYPNCEW